MSRALKSLAIFFAFVVIFTISRHYIQSSNTTTTTAPPSTTSTTALMSTCQGSDFKGVYNQGEGAAGTILASVTLTKDTSGDCEVKGYPLLTLQDESGAVIASHTSDQSPVSFPAAKANAHAALVQVSDGGVLNFSLGYSDVPVGNEVCASVSNLSVQFGVGGSSVPVALSYPIEPCNSATVWVSPFY